MSLLQDAVDEAHHTGAFARIFPPSSREELEALGALGARPTASPVGAISAELAIRMYGEGDARARRHRLIEQQEEGAEDQRRWDWYGLEGNWREGKAAVREENRLLMESIRAARNYDAPPAPHEAGRVPPIRGESVGESVGESIGESIGESVGESIGESRAGVSMGGAGRRPSGRRPSHRSHDRSAATRAHDDGESDESE